MKNIYLRWKIKLLNVHIWMRCYNKWDNIFKTACQYIKKICKSMCLDSSENITGGGGTQISFIAGWVHKNFWGGHPDFAKYSLLKNPEIIQIRSENTYRGFFKKIHTFMYGVPRFYQSSEVFWQSSFTSENQSLHYYPPPPQ